MDYSNLFNTSLTPEQEAAFQKWLVERSKVEKRDVSKDVRDYDLRGFYQSQGQLSENNHASDTFKKPNHPTFSNQSMYSTPEMQGGKWSEREDGMTLFEPSPINKIMYSPEQLSNYFNKVEPNSQVRFENLKNKLRK